MIKEIWKSFSNLRKTRARENERSLDFFDSDLFHMLKLLQIKGDLEKKDILEKRGLSEDRFNEFIRFSEKYKYVQAIPREKIIYSITPKGINFLLNFRKIQQEKSNTDVIKAATIVLAISAVIQAVDIWVNKPTTQNAILLFVNNSLSAFFSVIVDLIPVAIVIFLIVMIIKITKYFKQKKN